MSNKTTLMNVKHNLKDAEEQIQIMKNEFDKLKRMASALQETLDKVSLTFDKLDDDDGAMPMPNDVTFYAITSSEFEQLSKEEMHELDIQRMADEHINTRLATTDLPHREGE